MSTPQVAIAITADDKTAKGWSAAEKRAGSSVKRIGDTGKDSLKATQDGIGRSSRGIVRSFSEIERAGKSALSGGSIIGRGSAIRDVGILARGMGAAAAEGLGLEGAMVGVAGAAVGMTSAVVLAGAAMWKLSDGWGKGANQLGNMASLMGVSTSALQKFAGAAERVGVDKDTATSTLGSLSQTLNDARYGRNNGALAILGKMGVKLQTNKDGTVDVEGMLPQIATAMAAQNSSGRRTAGHALGISDAAMAAFTQGGGNLSAGMADYGRNGAMITDADTKLGRSLTERDVSAAQRVGKAWMGVQRWNATAVKGAGDAIIGAAGDASKLSPPSLIGPAGAQTLPTAGSSDEWGAGSHGGFGAERARQGVMWRNGGLMRRSDVSRYARRALTAYQRHVASGMSPEEAAGWAANGEAESGNNSHSRQIGGGPGRGTYQWGADNPRLDRRPLYERVVGKAAGSGNDADDERMRSYEVTHGYRWAQRRIDAGQSAGDKAAAITKFYEAPDHTSARAADRANIAEQIIKLEIEFKNAPAGGVSATAKSGHSGRPAISMAHNGGHLP